MGVAQNVGTGAAVGSAIPGVGTAVGAGAGAVFSLLQGLFAHKSKNAQEESERKALIAALTIRNQQQEDSRISHLKVAQNYLSNVPEFTAGGGVKTNTTGLPPELLAELEKQRTYDFASAVPDKTAGGTSALLSGLFGAGADLTAALYDPTKQKQPTEPQIPDLPQAETPHALSAPNVTLDQLLQGLDKRTDQYPPA